MSRLLLLLAAAAQGAHAGSVKDVLDDLRSIDLNDYAVGFGVSHTESIYSDAADTQTYYPYATRLFPSDFNAGVLFSRAGGYGLRWLPGGGSWELGALARYQTLGYDSDESPALAGLPSRRSTIEVGPTIGWRGAVRLDWTGFADVLRNHRGTSHLVRLSVPVQYPQGFLLPEIGFRHYTDDFVDYYFGVRAADTTIDRPAYAGTAATGMSFGLAWGFKIAPGWLLTGRAGVEVFGSGIADSPIVEDRDQSSWSLRLTYDGMPFQTPATMATDALPRVTLLFAAARATTAPLVGSAPSSGTQSFAHLDAGLRIARQQRLALGIIDTEYGSAGAADGSAELDIRNVSLTYGIAVLRDRQKDLTIEAGVHFSELEVAGSAGPEPGFASDTLRPRPTVGLFGTVHFAKRLSLVAKGQWLMLDGDRLSGRQILLSVGFVHRTFERVHLGIGYVFNRGTLDLEGNTATPQIEPLYDAALFLVTGAF